MAMPTATSLAAGGRANSAGQRGPTGAERCPIDACRAEPRYAGPGTVGEAFCNGSRFLQRASGPWPGSRRFPGFSWPKVASSRDDAPTLVLWLAGCAFWLGALHWLRLPHPATSIGWLALSGYLGIYLPVFIALVRSAMQLEFRSSWLPRWRGLGLSWRKLICLRGSISPRWATVSIAGSR